MPGRVAGIPRTQASVVEGEMEGRREGRKKRSSPSHELSAIGLKVS